MFRAACSVLRAGRRGQAFESEIFSDAVLQMHHEVAFFQLGKIDVESRTGGESMGRFEPARTLDFVSAENFGIRDHHQSRLVGNESAGEGADVQSRRIRSNLFGSHGRDARATKDFLPNFLEALLLAVVVAKNVDGVFLAEPAVKLGEKFATLRFGNLRIERAFSERTIGVETREFQLLAVTRFIRSFRQFQNGFT